jgi:hypothetical protein
MKSSLLLIVPALFISLVSCTKDADQSAGISDVTLSSMTTGNDLVLARTVQNEQGTWDIKMNAVAASAHAKGFENLPVNSMIVKEQKDADGKVMRYSVMYNAPADGNSSDGWLYSEFDADHHVIYSAAQRGMTCQSCHATISKFQQ